MQTKEIVESNQFLYQGAAMNFFIFLIRKVLFLTVIFFYFIFTFPFDLIKVSFYKHSKRVKKLIFPHNYFGSGTYCIYTIYSPEGIQHDHKLMLSILKNQGINLVCVFVGCPNEGTLQFLKNHSYLLLLRKNIGRDFGSYKDGIKELTSLQKERTDLTKLILLNDSCFIRKEGMDNLLCRLLNKEKDIVAPFEDFGNVYNLQSFCISVNAKVYFDERFQKFWNNYIPFSSRRHSINKGEKGLTKTLKKISSRVDVIFTVDLVGNNKLLYKNNAELNFEMVELLPSGMKNEIIENYKNDLLKSKTMFGKDKGLFLSNSATFREDQFKSAVSKLNGIHYLAPIFSKAFDCPMIKKDIGYRTVYSSTHEVKHVILDFYSKSEEKDLEVHALETIRLKYLSLSEAGIIKNFLIHKGFI